MGRSASLGLLVKNAETLENVGLISTAVFDKTGTITYGKMTVTAVEGLTDSDLEAISSIESKSSHAVAVAITEYASGSLEVSDFNSVTGKGVSGIVNGNTYYIGNEAFIKTIVNEVDLSSANKYLNEGKTTLFVAKNGKYVGLIAVGDKVKETSVTAIKEFKNLGVKTVILSGDNQKVTNAVTNIVSADVGFGEVLPEDKAKQVAEFNSGGKTLFVGDGVNDSPALTVADVGVAVGEGTDVAVTSADVVLMNNDLSKLIDLVKIGKKTRKIIKQNLFWAFFYNVLMIPVAGGVFSFIGLTLSPMIAAACMSLSSIIVVTNALRLKK